MGTWYASDWQPGVGGAGEYRPRGEGVELLGGPLDGRLAHVHDALEALFVARSRSGDVIVQSARLDPSGDLPAGHALIGRYVLDARSRSLGWERLENAGNVNFCQQAAVAAGPRRSPTAAVLPPFRLWRARETPPSPFLRLWRRLASLVRALRLDSQRAE